MARPTSMSPIRTSKPLKKVSSKDRNPFSQQRRSTEADADNFNSSATVLAGPKKMSVQVEKHSNTVRNLSKLEKDTRNGNKFSVGQR